MLKPQHSIAKWRASELKESSAAQSHLNDLCQLLGEQTPTEADPTGETYCFEKGARKDTGGDFHLADQPEGVHQEMTLTPFDLFTGVITGCFALGCRLDRLAIYTARRRGWLAALLAALPPL